MNRLKTPLDDTDKTLLRLLQQDGTLSNPKLAERLSLSVTPCWRRLKRLEEAGYIKDYQANLDRRKLGYDVLAFVRLSFGEHADDAPNRFELQMQERPEVLSCHKITGDADYLLQVVAPSLDAYSDFIETVLRKTPGLHAIHSSLALREIKAGSRLPI
ncbi:Lrp/AsnC family transcriptional regulator [Chromobacterium sp. LK1]|uniref:Lrp/AsnC family transcriptional regulator n=1 Tax=Chromobacterium sp. LK1 TaxID=1628193 RepID=UPI000AB8407D|nr:Lrp/AsnC family transcriptional regulator [Chromobacterium sp. LK1]